MQSKQNQNLFLYACDQKIEHLSLLDSEHLFSIAAQGRIGAMAVHLGLLARYGSKYPKIPYVVKLNGKTNLVPTAQKDPFSQQLWTVEQVMQLKSQAGLNIIGVGMTVYVGSESEAYMLEAAAQMVWKAREHGLISILWMYPRGKAVPNDRDGKLIAGCAGLAASLGADYAKINPPEADGTHSSTEWLAQAAQNAGSTKLICSGGAEKDPKSFLQGLYAQMHEGHTVGAATGRNIHSRPLHEAVAMTKAIAAIVYDGASVTEAEKLLAR